MSFYRIKPEVAGELGPNTTYLSTFPTVVGEMEYLFDRWPADEFVRAHPGFAVSARVRALIEKAGLTGVRFSECKQGKTDYFDGNQTIPKFFRLEPLGTAHHDDFGLNEQHHLIISEKANRVFNDCGLEQCETLPA